MTSPSGGAEAELRALVRRTAGLQPWRRVFHAANGVLIAGILRYGGLSDAAAVGILAAVFLLLLALDGLRLRRTGLNVLFFRLFLLLASPREAGRIASSTWYVLGVLLAVALFPREASVPAVLVLALADPAASVAGRRWGRRRIGAGSEVGALAFLLAAFLVVWPLAGPVAAAAGAAAGAAVELLPWRLDDNATIPPAVALAVRATALGAGG